MTLLCPSLFSELGADPDAPADLSRWPSLHKLLTRAVVDERALVSAEHALFDAFGLGCPADRTIPAAAFTARFDGLAPSSARWMRADPVYLRPDPNQILLFRDPGIMPSADEADALLETLDSGFEITFRRGREPSRWYIDLDVGALTWSAATANGRSIGGFLPSGDGAKALKQLMNDVQMLLHEHPVNSTREARGIPPINSIWPWGSGEPPGKPAGPSFVRGDDILAAALSEQGGIDWQAEADAESILDACHGQEAHALVVLGAPSGPTGAAGPELSLERFEHDWCVPIRAALRRRKLKRFVLRTDRRRYTCAPLDTLRAWRAFRSRGRSW